MVKVDVASVGALSCSIYCAYTNVLLPCMEKKDEEKGERWDPLSLRCASCRGWRGGPSAGALRRRWWRGRRTRRCQASGEAREEERGEERMGDVDATEQDIN
jgi:hypothetical protein